MLHFTFLLKHKKASASIEPEAFAAIAQNYCRLGVGGNFWKRKSLEPDGAPSFCLMVTCTGFEPVNACVKGM